MRHVLLLLALASTPAQAATINDSAHSVPVSDAEPGHKVLGPGDGVPTPPPAPKPAPAPAPAPTPVPAPAPAHSVWSDVFAPVPAGQARNRFRVLTGYGPDGLQYAPYGGGYAITPYYGPLFGFGYERQLWKQISVSVEGLSGASTQTQTLIGIAGVGFDW